MVSTAVTHVDVKYLENELKTRDRGIPIQYVTNHHHLAVESEAGDGAKCLASRRTTANAIVTFAARETSEMPRDCVARVHQAALRNHQIKHSCKILEDVEFLVTSGKVFARHRSTLEPFDPFNLSANKSHTANPPPLAFHNPPLPLNARQLEELLKLIGPEICLSLPWLRVPFSPQKVFADQEMLTNGVLTPSPPNLNLRTLISHQKGTQEFLASHSEQNNPMVYLNSYRRAPSVSIVKAHQGLFLFPLNDLTEMHIYLTSTVPLSVPILDLTVYQDYNVSIPVFDPIKPIRDNMICLERSLSNACLLDLNWGRNDHLMYDAVFWKKKVEKANSIKTLCSLLIDLVDACCLRAFVPHWYKVKESNLSPDGGSGRLLPFRDSKEMFSTLSEEWSPKQESIRRKWERCKGNEIRRLLNVLLVDIFSCNGPPVGKRGKKRKARDDSNNVTSYSTSSEKDSTISKDASNSLSALAYTDKQVSLFDASKEPLINESSSCKNGSCDGPRVDNSRVDISANSQGNGAAAESYGPSWSQDGALLFKPEPIVNDSMEVNNSDLIPSPSSTPEVRNRKSRGCGKCDACLQEDCRECNNCLDMKKYGGPNKIRQKCIRREDCRVNPASESKSSLLSAKSKSSKKKNLPRRESLASSTSRRRSEQINVLRQKIESLLGITEMKTGKIERAIVELTLDALEKLMTEDETTAVYWAIAGKLAISIP